MDSRNFDRRFDQSFSLFKIIFVIAIVGILATWVAYGFVAFKAVSALETECKGSIAYCLGKAKKQFDEGAK